MNADPKAYHSSKLVLRLMLRLDRNSSVVSFRYAAALSQIKFGGVCHVDDIFKSSL